ncbi:MAG TPA: ATP-binding protein, partial [Dehalococcoidia bacterium]|nr:ATP-binding protein [Dehalococcoidia bacterium]
MLTALTRRLCSARDVPALLHTSVEAACELTGARYGALAVFGTSGRIEEFVTHGLTPQERERIGEPPKGPGVLAFLHESQRPRRLADVSQHLQAVGFPPNHPHMKTFLGAPLRSANEALGCLYVAEKVGGREFSLQDEEMLAFFAAQAALAIRSLKSQQEARAGPQPEGEHRLQEADGAAALMAEVLESSSDFIAVLDARSFTVLSASNSLLAFLGRPQEAVLNRPCYDAFLGRDQPCAGPKDVCPLLQMKATGKATLVEKVYDAPGGKRAYMEVRASPVKGPDGSISHAVYVVRDVSDRKQAEDALEVERQKLQALVDTSPVGIFFASATGEVVLVNREAQRILGFTGPPEQGLRWYAQNLVFCRPDGTVYKPEELPLQRALSRGETVVAEEILLHFPDGHSLLALVNATPFYSPDGAITGVMAVIQDLTPLEESERLRNEFLGMVSHELKTPLAAIKGTAGMALGSQRYSQAPEVRELFEIVDEQADRLTGLVNNLLDMSRIEAGALSVSPEPADLSALLAEALEDFRRSYSHDVNLHIPEGLPPARADRRRVMQVVGNLLTNAAKFSPAAAPIEMELEHDGAHIIVRVRDHGRGIPKEKLPLLFRKFSQVHQEDGGRLGGSGLGLAIAKGIVEAHGGRIWAESAGDGTGSTFCFTLPVAARWPATQVSKDAVRAEGRVDVTHQGRRARVLAIDDDPHVLRLLRRCLGEAGYVPVMSNDPAQTIGLVECEVPDLVLLDLLLPGSSGFDLLQRIREFSNVPVIFLTASNLEEHTVRALKLGADDYITKPFSPSELLARIETALRRRVLPDRLEGRPTFVLEDLSVDYAERRVTRGEDPVNLSPTEYKVLYELSVNPGRVLTHDQLLQRVWGSEYSGETEIVRSMVRNLRRKLGDDARHPR